MIISIEGEHDFNCTFDPVAVFEVLPMPKIRQLADIIEEFEFVNRVAIDQLTEFFPEWVQSKKEEWDMCSKNYQNEYRLPDNYPESQRKAITSANNKLLNAVKRSKREYEKSLKIKELFNYGKHF